MSIPTSSSGIPSAPGPPSAPQPVVIPNRARSELCAGSLDNLLPKTRTSPSTNQTPPPSATQLTSPRALLTLLLFTLPLFPLHSSPAPNFEDDILPIFKDHCTSCHNPDKKKADLDLTTYAATMIGSSGGEVLKAGVADSSYLFMSIDHAEDVEPMPPKKPKLPKKEIELVRQWINTGLIASAGGKSSLREVDFDLSKTSVPAGSAIMPEGLPDPEPDNSASNAPVTSIAASPVAPLLAVAGQRQILLYGAAAPSDKLAPPLFKDRLVADWARGNSGRDLQFVTEDEKIGPIAHYDGKGHLPVPRGLWDSFAYTDGFTLAMWIRPTGDNPRPTILGGEGQFELFLEGNVESGFRPRISYRDADNAIRYFGRKGSLPANQWTHLAVRFDTTHWTTFINGAVVKHEQCPPGAEAFQQNDHQTTMGHMRDSSGKLIEGRGFIGDLHNVLGYGVPLSNEEVEQLVTLPRPEYELLATLPCEHQTIHDLRFSKDGSLLLAAGGRGAHSGSVFIYDVQTGEQKASIGDEQDAILVADISADRSLIAIGTTAKMVKIFSAANGKMLHRIDKHTEWVNALAFAPTGDSLATADRNGVIHVWEAMKGAILYTMEDHKQRVTDVGWRSDGALLASACEDGNVILWDMKDGWPVRTIKAHAADAESRYSRQTGVLDVEFSSNGKLITSGRDRSLGTWEGDGQRIATLGPADDLPTTATILHGSETVATGHLRGQLKIWDLVSGRVIAELR